MTKLAEALVLRADCQKRIRQLAERLKGNARIQEGDEPAEKPADLLREFEDTCSELLALIKRINKTNTSAQIADGRTLMEALAERDVLSTKRSVLEGLAQAAAIKHDRYTKSEVKFLSTIKVAELQRHIDAIAKGWRELDTKIQEANWQTDLLE